MKHNLSSVLLGPATRREADVATASGERWTTAESEGFLPALRRTLDKPLTSYHLILGVSALLLSLGLLMVLSASSVSSLRDYGSSYSVFMRQAIFVAVGLPLAWAASQLPLRLVRFLSWPALLGSTALVALTFVPSIGIEVNGNRNWISVGGPFQLQPSEFVKLALVLWCADVYARKGRLLAQWRHLLIPMMPVCLALRAVIDSSVELLTDDGKDVVGMSLREAAPFLVAGSDATAPQAPGRQREEAVACLPAVPVVLPERVEEASQPADPLVAGARQRECQRADGQRRRHEQLDGRTDHP